MRKLTLAVFCLAGLLALAGCKGGHDHDDHTGHNMRSPAILPH